MGALPLGHVASVTIVPKILNPELVQIVNNSRKLTVRRCFECGEKCLSIISLAVPIPLSNYIIIELYQF